MESASSFRFVKYESGADSIHEYKSGKFNGSVRIIKLMLPDGTRETLVTNIFDSKITVAMFKELYFLRWGIECKYKELKLCIEIEEFSGKKPIAIKQDFYASIYLSMTASIVKSQSDKELVLAVNNTKYKYQTNRNYILNRVFKYLIDMLIHHRKCKKIIEEIVKKAKKSPHIYDQTVHVSEKISIHVKSIIVR